MVVGGGRDPMLDLSTQAPLSLPTSSPQYSPDQQRRNRQGEWVLDHFTGRQLLNLAAERFHREDCKTQAALQRVIMDAGVFKVQTKAFLNKTELTKLFGINNNNIKVQQKYAGYLEHTITSVQDNKRLFNIEVEGIAGFACTAGLVNTRTNASEMDGLKAELQLCQHPLQLTEELRQYITAPTPPPALTSPPPPGLFSPRPQPSPTGGPMEGITTTGGTGGAPAGAGAGGDDAGAPSGAANVGAGVVPGL